MATAPFLLRFFLVIFCVFTSVLPLAADSGKKRGKVTTKHSNGTKASQGRMKDYKMQGLWRYWNAEGKLIKTATYVNDVLNGLYTEFYSNGQKSTEGTFTVGKREGQWNEWFTDGKQRAELNYTAGNFNGKQRWWFENSILREEDVYANGVLVRRLGWYFSGRPKMVENFYNGKREGEQRSYEDTPSDSLVENYSADKLEGARRRFKNGRCTEEANYLNGKLHGRLRRWDPSGNLGLEENYQNGQLDGETIYYENNIVLRRGSYRDGSKNGEFSEYSRKGVLLKNAWYTRGREDSLVTYFPNGKPATRKTSISGITLTETYEEFDEQGLLLLRGNSLAGQRQGAWTTFYPDGKKKSETPYVRGQITGTYRKWYANGKQLIEMECKNGRSISDPKIWNETGKPLKTTDKLYIALLESSLPGEIYHDPSQYGITTSPRSFDYPVMTAEGPVPKVEEEERIFEFAEEMPQFPGGQAAMMDYLRRNLVYPEPEKEAGIQGTVYVYFEVIKTGEIQNVRVDRGVNGGTGLDREAVRVIKSMPKWIPGKMNGRNVTVAYRLPVKFVLQ